MTISNMPNNRYDSSYDEKFTHKRVGFPLAYGILCPKVEFNDLIASKKCLTNFSPASM